MRFLLLTLVLSVATPAVAAPITWQSSGTVGTISDPLNLWSGLTAGTPWSLALTFDPSTPGQFLGGSAAAPCYRYATGSATLTLGGYNYSQTATGQDGVYTNYQFPELGCTGLTAPGQPSGLISFLFVGPWTQEPGAWNLNAGSPFMVASYYDLLATDGSLPGVPTLNPNPGNYGGLQVQSVDRMTSQFSSAFQPTTPVPEPASMMLFAAGLGGVLARRRKM